LARVHEYKRFENNFVKNVKAAVALFFSSVGGFLRSAGKILNRRYTLVLVPHSEKKIYNLQVTFFSIICAFITLAGIVSAVAWYGNSYRADKDALETKDKSLKNAQASLDELRDEVGALWKEARSFHSTLSGVFSQLGLQTPEDTTRTAPSGDLSTFFDLRTTAEGRLREADEIRSLANYLAETRGPIENLGKLLESQSALLTEVPNIWPVKDGKGHISMFFGENENPFTGQIYVHRGIDISTFRYGDPIVATADGQVVTVDYDSTGFGNYVIIRHKHGFYTRYGHMQSFTVRTGQRVQQGEIIGRIGSTGLSTGPHVHYEVHIGSDVVDPYKFLNVRSTSGKVDLNAGKS
jgi:murein DD-endopeptidase MepM/ murein hydrolase activator NlpD